MDKIVLTEIIKKLENVSPLDLPQALIEIELYEQQTAQELMDEIHNEFQKEDIIDNVVTPVFTTIIDGLLAHPKSSLLRYSCICALPKIGSNSGSSTFPIRVSWS